MDSKPNEGGNAGDAFAQAATSGTINGDTDMMPISAAAQQAGVNPSWIRGQVRKGHVRSALHPWGQRVSLSDVIDRKNIVGPPAVRQ